ncbi:hypothetical protein JMJ35_002333 [Cladonia borealis]|uniref:Uncharacterized protein n=1 Tax=Cladonia borealis TaxID=184061 RepID=A0AA39R776_9LECA|nr:hypothetical protein JMJ35_002333 [Cladonia borealis]
MSNNVIFDLSNVTARSKGQAIRRQHQAARQKRTGPKKQGSAERKTCKEPSQEAPLAPFALMEKPSDSIVKGHVKNGDTHHDHEVNSQIGSSAFTMFPTFQSTTNKRALGQASRYMNANASKRNEKDIGGRTPGTKSRVPSANGPDCPEPFDEDRTIAESTARMLMDIPKGGVPLVSCEDPKKIYLPEFEEKDSEQPWTINSTEPVRKATSIQQEYCLKLLRQHVTEDIAFKARRDRNVTHDHSCTMICGFCLMDPLPALNCFQSVGALKDHIVFMHFWEQYGSTSDCMTCLRSGFSPERLFTHVENYFLAIGTWNDTYCVTTSGRSRLAFAPTRCPLPFTQMLVGDMKPVGKGGSGSGDSLKYHLVTAHGARGIPVSALSNPMKMKGIGICQPCNVRS